MTSAYLQSDCPKLKLLARGKVRDLYDVDEHSLLFVATDRISAYDCIMKSGIPGKGKILTQLSCFWFKLLGEIGPHHLITADISHMPAKVREYQEQLEGRVMLVKKCKILPVEAIIRGYITGSGMLEYKAKGTVCDIPMPKGLVEADKLESPLFTPSTKAEIGDHDENIHPDKLNEIIGLEKRAQMEKWAIQLYSTARDYAATKGIIIADTKFEFGIDEQGQMMLVDEVLTPGKSVVFDMKMPKATNRSMLTLKDSSRFWPLKSYKPGSSQPSYDKQYLRDYLVSISFDKKQGIELPQQVIQNTLDKYIEAYTILTGESPKL